MSVVIIVSVSCGVALANMGGRFLNPEKHQVMIEKKAEAFGMITEEVRARLEEGESLKEIFGFGHFSKGDMTAKKGEWMEEKLAGMVEAGKITQEQADEKLEYMQNYDGKGWMGHNFNWKDKEGFHKKQ